MNFYRQYISWADEEIIRLRVEQEECIPIDKQRFNEMVDVVQ